MVQVLDLSPIKGPSYEMGQSMGGGLAKRMGLQEAETMASNAEGDPVKLAFSLARASIYAPELQRSLGQIYEQMLSRSQSGQYAGGLSSKEPSQPYNIPGGEANPDIAGEISPGGIIAPSADVPSNANPINRINAQNTDIQYPKGKYSADDIESLSFQFMSDLRPDRSEEHTSELQSREN